MTRRGAWCAASGPFGAARVGLRRPIHTRAPRTRGTCKANTMGYPNILPARRDIAANGAAPWLALLLATLWLAAPAAASPTLIPGADLDSVRAWLIERNPELRALQAEATLRGYETAKTTRSGDLFAEQRVVELEKENADLQARLQYATEQTRTILVSQHHADIEFVAAFAKPAGDEAENVVLDRRGHVARTEPELTEPLPVDSNVALELTELAVDAGFRDAFDLGHDASDVGGEGVTDLEIVSPDRHEEPIISATTDDAKQQIAARRSDTNVGTGYAPQGTSEQVDELDDGALIEPYHVSTFKAAGRGDRADDWVGYRSKRRFLCGGFALTRRLSHAAEDRAAIAHHGGVSHVDRIKGRRRGLRKKVHGDAAFVQRRDEPIVFSNGLADVGWGCEIQRPPLRGNRRRVAERVARMFEEDPRDRARFGLRCPGHFRITQT